MKDKNLEKEMLLKLRAVLCFFGFHSWKVWGGWGVWRKCSSCGKMQWKPTWSGRKWEPVENEEDFWSKDFCMEHRRDD